MRKTTTFGAAVIALAASGWIATAAAQAPDPAAATPPTTDAAPPAPDAATKDATKPTKPMHHKKMMSMKSGKMGKGKLVGTAKGDAAVEDLNAKSLDAAKDGKSFAPPTTPVSEPAAHAGDKMAPKHAMKPMKHHMMKKAAEPKPDAAAPAPDASTPAPDAPK